MPEKFEKNCTPKISVPLDSLQHNKFIISILFSFAIKSESLWTTPNTHTLPVTLPVLAGLVQFALLSRVEWRAISPVSVRPPTAPSELPLSPQVCHLFIDDGYGGLTTIPRLRLGEMASRVFLAGAHSPFPSTKLSSACWPGGRQATHWFYTAHDRLGLLEEDSGLC